MSISVQALPDKKENDVPEQPDKSGGQIRTNPDTYSCKSNPVTTKNLTKSDKLS